MSSPATLTLALSEREREPDRAATAALLADVLGGRVDATTVCALAQREAFGQVLRDARAAEVAEQLRAEWARLRLAFQGVPGFAPGPARLLRLLVRHPQAELELLRSRLVPWFVLFGPALERNAQQPVYRLVVELSTTFVLEACENLARLKPRPTQSHWRLAESRPTQTSPLPELLARPAQAGAALSRDDVTRLTASLKLPTGPAPATLEALVVHLFQLAKAADLEAELCARLGLEWRVRVDRYGQWGMLYPAAAAACWDVRARASATVELLQQWAAAT